MAAEKKHGAIVRQIRYLLIVTSKDHQQSLSKSIDVYSLTARHRNKKSRKSLHQEPAEVEDIIVHEDSSRIANDLKEASSHHGGEE